MNICLGCFYYSVTRFGAVCDYDGAYNPVREECRNFKPRSRIEEKVKGDIELTRLVASLIDRLVEISPKIGGLEDEELRSELLEACIAAKQIKRMLR